MGRKMVEEEWGRISNKGPFVDFLIQLSLVFVVQWYK
jgi:hypothetical protein